MSNEKYTHALFKDYFESKKPLLFNKLSTLKAGKQFFNPKLAGSNVEEIDELSFDPEIEEDKLIEEILASPPDGQFSVTGEIKWSEYKRTVNVRGYQKCLREAQIIDKSSQAMHLTVWGDDLVTSIEEDVTINITNLAVSFYNGTTRLTTTPNTKVSAITKACFDWSACPIGNQLTKICCPVIVTSKLVSFVSCPNLECRKKISIVDRSAKAITCLHCKHTTLAKRCTITYSMDVVCEKDGRQTKLTAFPECIQNYFNHEELPENISSYEIAMLEAENIDITYDKKKIITKLEDHKELEI